MKRIKLDNAAHSVKQFVRDLPVAPNGVELELAGKVIGKLVPLTGIIGSERATIIARGRELVKLARARYSNDSARNVEREIRDAINEVRGRQRQ